jgi:hypothetical protein
VPPTDPVIHGDRHLRMPKTRRSRHDASIKTPAPLEPIEHKCMKKRKIFLS